MTIIVSNFRLIKRMLNLLDEESISGSRSGREVVYRLDEKSTTSV